MKVFILAYWLGVNAMPWRFLTSKIAGQTRRVRSAVYRNAYETLQKKCESILEQKWKARAKVEDLEVKVEALEVKVKILEANKEIQEKEIQELW